MSCQILLITVWNCSRGGGFAQKAEQQQITLRGRVQKKKNPLTTGAYVSEGGLRGTCNVIMRAGGRELGVGDGCDKQGG